MSSTRIEERSVELRAMSTSGNPTRPVEDQIITESQETEVLQPDLEPTDGGKAAWQVLGATFLFEAFLWGNTTVSILYAILTLEGFPLSFGVFQSYYSQLPQFAGNPLIPVVGTVATGITYLGAPLMTMVVKWFPKYRNYMIWAGWLLCIIGLTAGSFATELGSIVVTQGVLYGLGFLISYFPILQYVSEFWIERRGMAFGVLCSSSAITGLVMPFLIETLLHRYGYQTTLRAIAVGLAVLTAPLVPLCKPRLPASGRGAVGRTDWSFLRRPLFWAYCISNILQGFGFFFPALYLPSYANAIGLSGTQGALLLSLLSAAQFFGQLTYGYASDKRVPINLLIATSVLVSGTATCALWGLARSLAVLAVFSLIYGFFAAGYTAIWARMGTTVTQEPSATMAVFGLLNFGKGLGNVISGPISAVLISPEIALENYGIIRYRGVILFTGVCMFCSGLSVGVLYLRLCRIQAAA